MGAMRQLKQARYAPIHDLVGKRPLIVGLGASGLSCAQFFASLALPVAVKDEQQTPRLLKQLRQSVDPVNFQVGPVDEQDLEQWTSFVISPGIAADQPIYQAARQRGIPVMGDVELFAHLANAPIAAVSGSNGKSTIVSWLAHIAQGAFDDVRLGGNIGTPVLDLITEKEPDLYILELSSFQLETTVSLKPTVALIANLSEDHLDRHGSMTAYAEIKKRLYQHAEQVVVNVDDLLVAQLAVGHKQQVSYSVSKSDSDYGICNDALVAKGQAFLSVDQLSLPGLHNRSNALACTAMCDVLGISLAVIKQGLRSFSGLPHRFQLVAEKEGVRWINDSKATNVGACLSALANIDQKVVLIAGGLAKGADFSVLAPVLAESCRALVLMGHDAGRLERQVNSKFPVVFASDMATAVMTAKRLSVSGDTVLLAPACASFDLFSGYQDRGDQFVKAVEAVT